MAARPVSGDPVGRSRGRIPPPRRGGARRLAILAPASGAAVPVEPCDVFHLDPAKVSALRATLMPDTSVGALAEMFKLLGDTTRVRILDAVSQAELCVCDLARLLGLSESAISHQLRLLRGMRLVRPRRAGRMVFYALDDAHIVRLFAQSLRHVEESARSSGSARRPDRARRA